MDQKEFKAKVVIDEAQKMADASGQSVDTILMGYMLFELNHMLDELKTIHYDNQQAMMQSERENSAVVLAVSSDHNG